MTIQQIRSLTVCVLAMTLALLSCSPTLNLLKQAKDYHQRGEYQQVASMVPSCGAADEGCNQLHLIKGDACFRLAKGGADPQKNYQCAAVELTQGIAMTAQWAAGDLALSRAQSYENLCETLRNLQDMEKGAQAEAITRELKKTAGDFAAAEPGHPVVAYYQGITDFTLMRRCLLHPEQCPSACSDMRALAARVDGGLRQAAGTRYEENYQRLLRDIDLAKRSLPGCN